MISIIEITKQEKLFNIAIGCFQGHKNRNKDCKEQV